MANSFTKVTLGAAQTVGFTTPTYIVSSHLTVSVNNVTVPAVQAGATQQVFGSFTSTNPLYYILVEGSTSLSFSEELPAGAVVLINRNSSQSVKLVSYSDSGLLTSDVLNEDSNQAFFIAQEALDQSAGNFDSSFEASQGVTVAKVAGIEALADVTDTENVVAALTAGTNITIAADGTISSTDTNTTYTVQDGELSQNNFTDADHTKLNAIEASADVTDTANVVAALTAGTNVAIASNGTISSTDTNTTYTGGTGLTLAGTTFNVDAAQTGITSVGALNGGSITSGFGAINIGSSSLTAGYFIVGSDSTYAPNNIINGGLTINNFNSADNLELVDTDSINNSSDPRLSFYRDSSSPADNDHAGRIEFYANNDADQKTNTAGILHRILDVTDGTEDGELSFTVMQAGTANTLLKLGPDGVNATAPLTITSSDTNADLVISNNEASSADASPIIKLNRSHGSSGGNDGDDIGKIQFFGANDRGLSSGGPEQILYASVYTEIGDASDGSEDGSLRYSRIVNGAQETGTLVLQPDNGGIQFPNLSTAPSSPQNGHVYYDVPAHKLKIYENGAWVNV